MFEELKARLLRNGLRLFFAGLEHENDRDIWVRESGKSSIFFMIRRISNETYEFEIRHSSRRIGDETIAHHLLSGFDLE